MGRRRQPGRVPNGVTTAPGRMTLASRLTPATFPALCSKGHRIIPSNGACYDVRELQPDPDGVRVFEYAYLPDCGLGQ